MRPEALAQTGLWEALLVLGLAGICLARPRIGILVYLSGLILGSRDFAYLHFVIGRLPLFVTEACLFGFLLRFLYDSWKNGHLPLRRDIFLYNRFAWLCLFIVGGISVIRGLFSEAGMVLTLRNSSLIYYGLFYFLTLWLLGDLETGKRCAPIFFWVIVAKTFQLSLVYFFSVEEGLWGTEGGGEIYLALGIVGIGICSSLYPKIRRPLALLVGLMISVVVLSMIRTIWVALLAASLSGWVLLRRSNLWSDEYRRFALTSGVIGVCLSLAMPWLTRKPEKYDLLRREIYSLILLPFPERADRVGGNINIRLWMWRDVAMDTFSLPEKAPAPAPVPVPVPVPVPAPAPAPAVTHKERLPSSLGSKSEKISISRRIFKILLGSGFGRVFWAPKEVTSHFHPIFRLDPHNSFFGLLFRTGLSGMLLVLWIVLGAIRRAALFQKLNTEKSRAVFSILAACFGIYCFVQAQADVVLESPFRAVFFWVSLGLCDVFSRKGRPGA